MASSIEIPTADRLFKVDGLVAVVTGAAGGIGLLMARALEANGARVFILDINEAKLSEACKTSKFGKITAIKCDITSQESLSAAAALVELEAGYIDLLMANAGTPGPYPPHIPPGASLSEAVDALWNVPLDAFVSTYKVNNAGTFYTALAFLKLLDAGNKRPGRPYPSQIITTASITAFNRQVPSGFAYGTSKAAVIHLAKQLSTYLIPYGIRCNAIAPGLYPTDMSQPALDSDGAALLATIPAGRTGTVDDIAGAVLFLASPAGSYCNGMVILSDGGRLSGMPATY